MKAQLLLAAVIGCGVPVHDEHWALMTEPPEDIGTAEFALGEQPLTFGLYGGSARATRGQLYETLDCAAERWRSATCLPIDVSFFAAHWIRWEDPEDMPASGPSGYAWGNDWNNIRVKINDGMPLTHRCPVLVHEMGHILRRNYGHPCADGSMCFPVTHSSTSTITQEDLTLVCAKQDCGCQIPE